MSKKKDPAFLFYPKDWFLGTAEMMPDEKGVYIDLLCHQHQNGSIPADPVRIARIVGLSLEEFTRIWSVVSREFDRTDDRLVNRKMVEIMTDRSEKGLVNTITGTFAAVLRKNQLKREQYLYVKSQFDIEEWKRNGTERLTERLTEWITERLKSIANANANGNANISFSMDKYSLRFREVLKKWIDYKKSRKESYKSQESFDLMAEKIQRLSGGNDEKAMLIVKQSMENNWAGLFELKDSPKSGGAIGVNGLTVPV